MFTLIITQFFICEFLNWLTHYLLHCKITNNTVFGISHKYHHFKPHDVNWLGDPNYNKNIFSNEILNTIFGIFFSLYFYMYLCYFIIIYIYFPDMFVDIFLFFIIFALIYLLHHGFCHKIESNNYLSNILSSYHLKHHTKCPNKNYSVIVPIFDIIFGTYAGY